MYVSECVGQACRSPLLNCRSPQAVAINKFAFCNVVWATATHQLPHTRAHMFTRLPSIASTSCTASRHRPYGLLLAWQQPHQRKCDSLRPANGATSQHWMAWHRDAQGWQLGITWYNWVWWTWKFIAIKGNHWQTIGGWEAAWWSNGTVWNTHVNFVSVQPAAANFWRNGLGQICWL